MYHVTYLYFRFTEMYLTPAARSNDRVFSGDQPNNKNDERNKLRQILVVIKYYKWTLIQKKKGICSIDKGKYAYYYTAH